ncbi:MAG: hypothetical protein E7355_04405 [Clostridiales bacterium]|nr:hypothetical protein [Clostridiales bacterium]
MKKTRKILLTLATLFMSATTAFGLGACGDDGESHQCSFTQKVVNATYKATEADCTNPATYYYSCTCGEKGTDKFTFGDALGHTGGTATTESGPICERCDEEYGVSLGVHICVFDQEVVNDDYKASEATCIDPATYYYSCVCGEATTEDWFEFGSADGAHTGGEATEENGPFCDLCGEEYGEPLGGHEHAFDQEVVSDAYKATAADCENAATYFKSCTCGEKGTDTFEFGEALGHTGGEATTESGPICDVCGEEYGEKLGTHTCVFDQEVVNDTYKASDADCENAATYYKSCAQCGEKGTDTFTFGEALGHTGGTATTESGPICERCHEEYGEPLDEHTCVFDQEVVNDTYKASDATCLARATYFKSCTCGEKGTETFTFGGFGAHKGGEATTESGPICDVCGEEYGEKLPSEEEHECVFNQEVVNDTYKASDADCENAATYFKSCVCGEKSEDTFVYGQALGHIGGTATTESGPICERCHEEYGEALGAHTCVFDQEVVNDKYLEKEADCQNYATYYKSCAECGAAGEVTFSYEEGGFGAHKGGEATTESGPICDVCGEEYGEKLPEEAHVCVFDKEVVNDAYRYKKADCINPATYYKSCACGEIGTDTFTFGEALGHTGGEATEEYGPFCDRCGEEYGEKLGVHTCVFDQEIINDEYKASDATCLVRATYYYACSVCGEKGTETFEYGSLAAHKGGEATTESGPICDVCGQKYGEKLPSEEEHECVFNQEVVNDTYKASDADCINPATYFKSCECGEKGTDTFTFGEALGHIGGTATTENGPICERCGEEYGEKLPGITQLPAPEVTLSGNVASWTKDDNADGYVYKIGEVEYDAMGTSVELKDGETVVVKALGNIAKRYSDSDWSNAVTFNAEELATPVVTLDYNEASWTLDENATGYKVKVNGIEVLDAAMPYVLKNGDNIQVQAISNNVLYKTESAWSNVVTFTAVALSAPVVTLDKNIASWEAVDNAIGYVVFVGNEEQGQQEETTYTLKDGETLTVKAIGDGETYVDSAISTKVTFHMAKLTAPVVSVEGNVATWEAVANATGYVVTVNGVAQPQQEETTYALNDGDVVTVKAIGDGTLYKDSNESDEVVFIADQLATPVVTLDYNVASWTAVANASEYKIKVNGVIVTQTETTYTLVDGDKIQVMAVSSDVNYKDSLWSVEKTFTAAALSAPVVTLDYNKASWTEVANATGYIVTLNGVEQAQQSEKTYTLKDGDTISVKAVGNGTLYKDSASSSVVTFTAATLSAPVVTLSGNVASWAQVANATGYTVKIGEEESFTTDLSVTLTHGQTVTVKAAGEAGLYKESAWSNAVTFMKKTLSTPVVSLSGNVASWEAVANASEYAIYIDGALKTTQTGLTYALEANEKLTVKAVGDVTLYNDSSLSNEVSFTQITLTAPAITLVGNTAKWNAVANATGYIVTVNGVAQPKQTATTYTLNSGETVTVKAVGDGNIYLDSAASNSVSFMETQLAAPVVTISGNVASWGAVANASGYIVTVNGVEQAQQNATTYTLNSGETVTVKAVGDGTIYINSAPSNEVSFTATKLGKVVVTLDGNVATWEAVANADYYVYTIGGVEKTTTNRTITLTNGQSLKVKAVSESVLYTDGDWSNVVSFTATKLETPAVSVSDSGSVSWYKVTGATSYVYSITGGEEEVINATTTNLYAGRALKDGETVTVKAVGNGSTYLDSDWSEGIKYAAGNEKPDDGEVGGDITGDFDESKVGEKLNYVPTMSVEVGQRGDIPTVYVEYDGAWYRTFPWVTTNSEKVDVGGRGTRFYVDTMETHYVKYYLEAGNGVYEIATTTVNVIDTQGPTFNLPASANGMLVYINQPASLPDWTAFDYSGVQGGEKDGVSISVTYNGSAVAVSNGKFTPTAFGNYIVTYTAKDTKGNSGSVSFTINCARMVEICNFDSEDVANAWQYYKGEETLGELSTEFRYGDTGSSLKVVTRGTTDGGFIKVIAIPNYFDLSGFDEIAFYLWSSEDMGGTSAGVYLLNNEYNYNSPTNVKKGENIIRYSIEDFSKDYYGGKILESTKNGYRSADHIWFQFRGPAGAELYIDNIVGIFHEESGDSQAPMVDMGAGAAIAESKLIDGSVKYGGAYGNITSYAGEPIVNAINKNVHVCDNSMNVTWDYTVTLNGANVTSAVKSGKTGTLGETYIITVTARDGSGRTTTKSEEIVIRQKFPTYDMTGMDSITMNYCNTTDTISAKNAATKIAVNSSVDKNGKVRVTTSSLNEEIYVKMTLPNLTDSTKRDNLTVDAVNLMQYINIKMLSHDAGPELSLGDGTALCRLKSGWNNVTIDKATLIAAINNGAYNTTTGMLTLKVHCPLGLPFKFDFAEVKAVYAQGDMPFEKELPLLNTPLVNIDETTGVATWEAIENAVNYTVFINGTEVATITELTYTIAQEGDVIQVRANGDGVNYDSGKNNALSIAKAYYNGKVMLNNAEDLIYFDTAATESHDTTHVLEGKYSAKLTTTANWTALYVYLRIDDIALTKNQWRKYEYVEFNVYTDTPGQDLYILNTYFATISETGWNTVQLSTKMILEQIDAEPAVYNNGFLHCQLAKAGYTVYMDKIMAVVGNGSAYVEPEQGGSSEPAVKGVLVNGCEVAASYWSNVNGVAGSISSSHVTQGNYSMKLTASAGDFIIIYIRGTGDAEMTFSDIAAEGYDFLHFDIYNESDSDVTLYYFDGTTPITTLTAKSDNAVQIPVTEIQAQLAKDATQWVGGEFRFKVQANCTLYFDNVRACYAAANPDYTGPTNKILSIPNVTLTGNVASWDAVANASGYEYSFDEGVSYASTSATSITLSVGQSLIVRAVGNSTWASSPWSDPIVLEDGSIIETNVEGTLVNDCETIQFWVESNATMSLSTAVRSQGSNSIRLDAKQWNYMNIYFRQYGVDGNPVLSKATLAQGYVYMDVYNASTSTVEVWFSNQTTVALTLAAESWTHVRFNSATISSYFGEGYCTFFFKTNGVIYVDNVQVCSGTSSGNTTTPGNSASSGGNGNTGTTPTPTPTTTYTMLNNCDAYGSASQIKYWVESNGTASLSSDIKKQGGYSIKLDGANWNYVNVYMRNSADDSLIPLSTLASYDSISMDIYNAGTRDVELKYKDQTTTAATLTAGQWTTVTFNSTQIATWFGEGHCTFYPVEGAGVWTLHFDNIQGVKTA